MKKKNKQLETPAAAPEAVGPAKLGGQSREEWLAIRKKAGRKINPETADIKWEYGNALDPYGIRPEFWGPYHQFQWNYFARSPRSDIWVFFYDLPTATRHALWKKHRAKLASRLRDKEARALHRNQQEFIKLMEYWWDWVESGKSVEELAIMMDIHAAGSGGGAISEQHRKISHRILKLIKGALNAGLNRREAMGYLRRQVEGAYPPAQHKD